jgi:hypothetical protein
MNKDTITEEKTDLKDNIEVLDKHDKKQVGKPQRNSKGHWLKGESGNPNGRPKKEDTIVEKFRTEPRLQGLLEQMYTIANTIGDDNPHKDALACTKLIIERVIPSLKASELRVDTDNDTGLVYLPQQTPAETNDD